MKNGHKESRTRSAKGVGRGTRRIKDETKRGMKKSTCESGIFLFVTKTQLTFANERSLRVLYVHSRPSLLAEVDPIATVCPALKIQLNSLES